MGLQHKKSHSNISYFKNMQVEEKPKINKLRVTKGSKLKEPAEPLELIIASSSERFKNSSATRLRQRITPHSPAEQQIKEKTSASIQRQLDKLCSNQLSYKKAHEKGSKLRLGSGKVKKGGTQRTLEKQPKKKQDERSKHTCTHCKSLHRKQENFNNVHICTEPDISIDSTHMPTPSFQHHSQRSLEYTSPTQNLIPILDSEVSFTERDEDFENIQKEINDVLDFKKQHFEGLQYKSIEKKVKGFSKGLMKVLNEASCRNKENSELINVVGRGFEEFIEKMLNFLEWEMEIKTKKGDAAMNGFGNSLNQEYDEKKSMVYKTCVN